MKVTISPKDVSPLLKKMQRVIANKNAIAVLDNFAISVNDKNITVYASDSVVMAMMEMPIIAADSEFGFCVNASKFAQAISAINSDAVELTFDGDAKLTGRHKKGHFSLGCISLDEYPKKELSPAKESVDINAETIQRAINSTLFAASTDTLVPALNGVFFDFDDGNFNSVCTDTRMLVVSKNANIQTQIKPFTIPTKAAQLLSSFINDSKDNIKIQNDENSIAFSASNWMVWFRQVVGKYPKYSLVMPKPTTNNAVINKNEFNESLNRVLLFAGQNSQVRLKFTANNIELTSQDVDYNLSSGENVTCEYFGDEIFIGFNGQALSSILYNMNCETFTINLTDEKHAALIKPVDDDITAVLMPMVIDVF